MVVIKEWAVPIGARGERLTSLKISRQHVVRS
jgi:hypothetical protein